MYILQVLEKWTSWTPDVHVVINKINSVNHWKQVPHMELTTLPVPASGKRPHSMMLHHQASLQSWYWFGGELCLIYSEHDASHRAALCLLRLTITIPAWLVFLRRGSPPSTEEPWSSDRVTVWFSVTTLTMVFLPWWPSLHGWLVVPNFFNSQMMETTVLIGTFKAGRTFSSNPSSGLSLEIIPVLSWRSTNNSIHPAWFAQHATVGPYMNRYCMCLFKSCPFK